MIASIIAAFLLITGAAAAFIAALGIVRMPDLFCRMQAAAKTGTLATGCVMLAIAFYFDEVGVTTRAILILIFLFLTAPIAAHMIARAAYVSGVPLWEETILDELKDQYDAESRTLKSRDTSSSGD